MIRQKILIVDKMHESIVEMLEGCGFIVDYTPDIAPSEILDCIPNYHGIIVRSKVKIDKGFLDKGTSLRFVARAGAGIDNIDYPYLSSKGIKLINAPEGNRDALGEHAVGMLLSLLNHLTRANLQIKQRIWDREGNRGMELKGKTVGIYGYGYMGSAFSEKLRGFDCKIVTYDKYKTNVSNEFVEQLSLSDFFREVEILSVHVPLTSETRLLFDREYLARFSRLKVLLNTSRGEVMKLAAINELLDSGKLFGAALDVLENEKLDHLSEQEKDDFEKLVRRENVLLTPHVAGWTFESFERINQVIVSKLQEEGLAQAH